MHSYTLPDVPYPKRMPFLYLCFGYSTVVVVDYV